jgi:hypothetical protein
MHRTRIKDPSSETTAEMEWVVEIPTPYHISLASRLLRFFKVPGYTTSFM